MANTTGGSWRADQRRDASYKEALLNSNGGYSIFVEGFPERASWIWLRNMFRDAGTIMDVFIPRKRTRNGNHFAFIRFNSRWEAEKAIRSFDGMLVAGNRIKINYAQVERKRQIWRQKEEPKVGAEKVKETTTARVQQENQSPVLRIVAEPDEEILGRLRQSIVGTTTEVFEAKWLLKRFEEQGWKEIWVSRISEWKYILGFYNESLRAKLKENDWRILRTWFRNIEPWSLGAETGDRPAVISIQGLPLMLWNRRNLERIVNVWGKMNTQVPPKHLPGDARQCFISIETKLRKRIEGEVELQVGDNRVKIGISEKLEMPVIEGTSEEASNMDSSTPEFVEETRQPSGCVDHEDGCREKKPPEGKTKRHVLYWSPI